jgi:simple sugar transport system ATP-binding protein
MVLEFHTQVDTSTSTRLKSIRLLLQSSQERSRFQQSHNLAQVSGVWPNNGVKSPCWAKCFSHRNSQRRLTVSVAVELRHISKRFPGVIANKDVSLKVETGTVHALVGENGAGKSTVMKILYGMQRPDSGEILVNGKEVHFKNPNDAIDAGIGMVHQHFMLADNFTVLENIILGSEPKHRATIDFAAARKKIVEMAAQYGLEINPDVLVEELGVGQRQRVEILKVLFRGANILIFDEPTAVLVPQEVDDLFKALDGLRAQGMSVIFISHKLDEVLRVADEVTVVRQGSTVAEVKSKDVTARQLAELMVGSELPKPSTLGHTRREEITLALKSVSIPANGSRDLISNISFNLHAGEVVGIAGVEGNGQAELVEAIMGLREYTGSIEFQGGSIDALSVAHRHDLGIGLIPEDRQRQSLLMTSPLWENRILGHQRSKPVMRGFVIDKKATIESTRTIMQEFDVRAPGPDTLAAALSGGNQQKFIVGREMSKAPALLVASHPTRGVDVGAQGAIWDVLRKAREKGMAVVLISADLEELIGMSDRLLVMLRGTITAELDPAKTTPEQLGSAMTGAA